AFLFQQDPESTYNVSIERADAALGVSLRPRINTGIMLFPLACLDLHRCDDYLADPEVARPTGFIEQTLYALHASETRLVTYLPESYLVDLRAGLSYDGIVARHYAGPSRTLLTDEGMVLLASGAGRLCSRDADPSRSFHSAREACAHSSPC